MAKPIKEEKLETKDGKEIITKTFADSRLQYGKTWAVQVKQDEDAYPSPEEMLIGLYKWLCNQLEEQLRSLPDKEK